jgi:hypothetical protein
VPWRLPGQFEGFQLFADTAHYGMLGWDFGYETMNGRESRFYQITVQPTATGPGK